MLKALSKTWILVIVFCLKLNYALALAEPLTVAGGTAVGVGLPISRTICDILNANTYDPRCLPKLTKGMVYNFDSLVRGKSDLAATQLLWIEQYTKQHSKQAISDVYQLFNFGALSFFYLARKEAGIENFKMLPNSIFNRGQAGAATNSLTNIIKDIYHWDFYQFKKTLQIPNFKNIESLCKRQIDSFAFSAHHPSDTVRDMIDMCRARFISLPHDLTDKMLSQYQYLQSYTIPKGTYHHHQPDINTIASDVVVVSNGKLDANIVYEIAKGITGNLNKLRDLKIIPEDYFINDLFKPNSLIQLHPGIEKFLQDHPEYRNINH